MLGDAKKHRKTQSADCDGTHVCVASEANYIESRNLVAVAF